MTRLQPATWGLMAAFVLLFAGGAAGQEKGTHHRKGMKYEAGMEHQKGMEHKKGMHEHAGAPAHEHPVGPVRTTMEELHRHGGVPPGWTFTLPAGDRVAGWEVYRKMTCYECHEVKGAGFPPTTEQKGPELTAMGHHHPAEYFAEAILNPNSVIITGPGHTGPDGLSIMPDYNDSLTVSQLVDLVAYLRSLRGEH